MILKMQVYIRNRQNHKIMFFVQCELIPRNRLCWTRVPLVSYDLLKIELENGKKREGKGGHALSVFLEKHINVPFSYEYALLDF